MRWQKSTELNMVKNNLLAWKVICIFPFAVNPNYRGKLAQEHYNRFLEEVGNHGVHIVRCLTSPVNKQSIAYHTSVGFVIVKGDKVVDGVSVYSNYDGKGVDRVLFAKRLGAKR
ncbi:GNAT family N-acetyltransferase [Radiobacillus deserti]|uniref:GNAT family N-acetyltransferase n=1 Tax=Radiobacillus deserti TaxID=2594883 RepID=A0A516KE35_9BACI|nr:GNAT family N-acetyltransferase [Radiobacillus deserti]QDP39576.1 GNAT family N-acetyltransferase [Radiobacillus deserti]